MSNVEGNSLAEEMHPEDPIFPAAQAQQWRV